MYKFSVGKYISSQSFRSADEAKRAAMEWISNFVASVVPVNAIKVFRA